MPTLDIGTVDGGYSTIRATSDEWSTRMSISFGATASGPARSVVSARLGLGSLAAVSLASDDPAVIDELRTCAKQPTDAEAVKAIWRLAAANITGKQLAAFAAGCYAEGREAGRDELRSALRTLPGVR